MKHLNGILAAVLALGLAACPGGGKDDGGGALPGSPSPVADVYTVDEDNALIVAAVSGVLSNDSNPGGGDLAAELVEAPATGILAFQASGAFTFSPATNTYGDVSFAYRIRQDAFASDPVEVHVAVNPMPDPPTASGDSAVTAEDTPLVVLTPGVLANDSDADADPISAVLVTSPLHGSVTLQADGAYAYTPATNYNGPDSFSYKAKDDSSFSNVVSVAITVTPVNDAPVATNHVYSSDLLGHLVVAAPGVLAGATDVEGAAMTAALSSPASGGTLALAADGSLTFNAGSTQPQVIAFTYTVSDGAVVSAPANVWILVNEVDPGPVYGSDYSMFKYPGLGSGLATAEVWHEAGYAQSNGFVVDRTGTYAYSLAGSTDNGQSTALNKIKLSDGSSSILTSIPSATISWPNGLDIDASGRIYTVGFSDGKVARIDPASGAMTLLGTIPALPGALLPGPADLAVGPDGNVYVCALNSSIGATWVWRFNTTTGATTPWATAPQGADGGTVDGSLWMGGIAMNDAGEAFLVNLDSKRVVRHKDLNGDGDAEDAGETVAFCDLPVDFSVDGISMGICVGAGGSVFVNVASWSGSGGFGDPMGIYWLRDRNGDGDAQDPAEAIPYHPQATAASFDLGCIGARRQ